MQDPVEQAAVGAGAALVGNSVLEQTVPAMQLFITQV